MSIVRATIVAFFTAVTVNAPAYAGSQATITGVFAEACRDFAAHSTKDTSHVVVHYADGRVVKDESTGTPDHAVDGSAGDEIGMVEVKSGTTTESFRCGNGGSPLVARLEIRLSPFCQPYTPTNGEPYYWCLDDSTNAQRTVYVDPGDMRIDMGCLPSEPDCFAITVRGTGSTDPDGDIVNWSIAFGDDAVVSGEWGTTPPEEVTHEYAAGSFGSDYAQITLTVTDARGQVATDTVDLAFFDQTPD